MSPYLQWMHETICNRIKVDNHFFSFQKPKNKDLMFCLNLLVVPSQLHSRYLHLALKNCTSIDFQKRDEDPREYGESNQGKLVEELKALKRQGKYTETSFDGAASFWTVKQKSSLL